MKGFVPVNYDVIRETEKAVYCCTKYGRGSDHHEWLPKAVCQIGEYVATTDYQSNPETYGKRVTGIAEWFARKNHIV